MKRVYIVYTVLSVALIINGLIGGRPPHGYLFFPVTGALFFWSLKTRWFHWLYTRAPGEWWMKATVIAVAWLGLYEWVRTW